MLLHKRFWRSARPDSPARLIGSDTLRGIFLGRIWHPGKGVETVNFTGSLRILLSH